MRRLGLAGLVAVVVAGLGAAVTGGAASAADAPADVYAYLDDPRRIAENQVAPHAELRPYADVASARAGADDSPWVRSLDGTWRLSMADRPQDVPARFWAEDFDTSGWRAVTVPHTWQSDGLDHPVFRNTVTEMSPDDPPRVPRDVNPTGAYVRTVDVPQNWAGRRSFLRFEGVTSGYFVWVNGQYVGYDQGGYVPAEFELTSLLRPGRNTVAVQVHRWSAGSHLEVYDQWRFSGIFRSSWLYSTPGTALRDVTITTPRTDELRAVVAVDGAGAAGVRGRLFDARGAQVATFDAPVRNGVATLSGTVAGAKPWTDETPELYRLVVELLDGSGAVTHVTGQPVGFRVITVADRQLKVNGKRVVIRGTNHSDVDPDHGRHVPRARMRQDVELLKRFNLNAIRTAHYPSDPYLYALADEQGLWIDDEVEVETHHHDNCPSNCLADRPEYQDAFLDRFIGLVQRDKNHPSVLLWDTGNEAGLGAAHTAMAAWADQHDPTRPLYHQPNNPDGDAPFADVWGPRYPSPDSLADKARTTTKPIIMGEYVHAQGNSLGNLREFWDVVRENPSVQGGFIWDWVDQQLRRPLRVVPDTSGHGITAWINGMPAAVAGHDGTGRALSLSGLDDFVEVYRDPSLDAVSTGLTLDAWVKPATPWTGDLTIVAKGDHQYALKMKTQNTLEFFIHSGTWQAVQATVPADWYDRWHRVSGSYDGTTLRLFIDGVQVGQKAFTGTIDASPMPVNIGRNAETMRQDYRPGRMAHGAVDDVRVYHRALTPAQLAADPKTEAALALDFDTVDERGTYLSYGAGTAGNDGMVSPDRVPQPETAALAAVHSPIRIARTAGGALQVTSERTFTGTGDLRLRWQYEEAGGVLTSGSLPLDVPAGGTATVAVPAAPANPGNRERHLTVRAELVTATDWAPAGHAVAVEQFPAGGPQIAGVAAADPGGSVRTTSTADAVQLSGSRFVYTVNRRSGTLSSMRVGGAELLRSGPELDVWRPPLSNDEEEARSWRAVGLDRLVTTVSGVDVAGSAVTVRSTVAAPGVTDASFRQEVTYTVAANGDVRIAHRLTPQGRMRELPMLPRVGLRLGLPSAMDRFTWYGRGPGETYPDRVDGSPVGVYSSTVDEQYVPYENPQEYGNHTGVRWASLSDGTRGLLVAGDLHVGVTPFRDIDRAQYGFALQRTPGEVTLRADHAVSGVAETFHSVLPGYRVAADREYAYTMLLRPLSGAEAASGRPAGPETCAPAAGLTAADPEVEAGGSTTLTLTVTNSCPAEVRDVTAVTRLPAGWTAAPVALGTVPAGATRTATVTVTRGADTAVGEYPAIADVTGVAARKARVYAASAPVELQANPAPPAGDTALADATFLRVQNGWGPVERDRSNGEDNAGDGRPMVINGVPHARGLGVHADSSVAVHLGGRCASLTAAVGVDDETGAGGSVVFEVWADGVRRWASPRKTGNDAATDVNVPLTGVRRVELRVTDAADGNANDHADWGSAVLHCAT
ncbi:glycoside hydrolase family 2 TIM barrel-domain containing protein [Pseudosporangium ferrugineum]|uniref:beta-galactosidase n=1 Tax=Pseudosporangium ferrugineum TaxID=439699 RepID=A0A2T0SB07_9ACTN|nr:glycoside hydrolase family 2 TIM barrel-domain containing protein [Pseudosporangium ferrugineum]PRY30596.1 beta-galactosidase [Pseudosporangium ferrugineum]